MYTHILLLIHGSATSDRGVEEAVKLAKLTGAQLRLITVVEALIYSTDVSGGFGILTADLLPLLRGAGERVEASGFSVDTASLDSSAGRVCDLAIAKPSQDSAPAAT
ncbi:MULTISPECIES: universal stress protein [unclassified Variovorax]|uniref:universal stress protein n=1 Tax=unclassified Variovorax TaxID=663243 RepID=UPI00076C1FF8|nr:MULTISPECIES: universal stress protein [unclassified Variovorax]KWT91647.1 UspA [Variovorax sp. WDL1]PNG49028.1 hypothetical protein CHC07_06670 [Variovorax sp. B4]PNG49694.1 hypothetical protein CHC06_05275 [Variovorax sp. B2]VTV18612.1 Universal stress protein family protein [Variovorax sp. WDL1]